MIFFFANIVHLSCFATIQHDLFTTITVIGSANSVLASRIIVFIANFNKKFTHRAAC